MGLFINKNEHPDVFKNNEKIQVSNQGFVRHNYLAELIQEQQKTNLNLEKSISELKPQYEQLEELHTKQWNHVKDQIDSLIVSSHQREKLESMLIQRITTLGENESLEKKSLIDQISNLNEAYNEIVSRLEKSESDKQLLLSKLNMLIDQQKDVADLMLQQEEFQNGVLDRLDTQEALIERISHSLNHVRSIIFERASYLTTKLEESYKQTTDYVYKLLTGSDKKISYTTSVNKKDEKEKEKQTQTD
ncbi:hypothetical protein [Gottfriedia luciferensis]|uniref:hypothetical protein n=1 Tax=Gottfriedia luciferensis TaxID=178774 RepID=UPI000B42D568|nr:hypothetical protein [Gottfriedia luciferensis]